MVEYRCEFCHKLLLKWEGTDFTVEIVCTRCNSLHTFGMQKSVSARHNPEGLEPRKLLPEVFLCQTCTDSPKSV
jgi:phage FluMu protein Com